MCVCRGGGWRYGSFVLFVFEMGYYCVAQAGLELQSLRVTSRSQSSQLCPSSAKIAGVAILPWLTMLMPYKGREKHYRRQSCFEINFFLLLNNSCLLYKSSDKITPKAS